MNDPARPRVSKPVLILWGTVGLLVALGCGTPAKVASTPSGTGVTATAPVTSPDTAVPKVMPDVKGKQLDVAKSDIKSSGFTDKVEVIGGGVAGVVVDANWKVCAQSPEAGQAITAAPKLTVDRTCGGGTTTPTMTAIESTTTAPAPSEPPTTSTEPEGNLTVATSPELAAILNEADYCAPSIEQFASKYRGRTIEFDGNIANVGGRTGTPPLDRTDKRQDVLMYAGDHASSEAGWNDGPAFRFEEVNFSGLNLTGPNIPDHVGVGDDLHVIARIGVYNKPGCVFQLDPISTSVR